MILAQDSFMISDIKFLVYFLRPLFKGNYSKTTESVAPIRAKLAQQRPKYQRNPTWVFLIDNKCSRSNCFSETEHINPVYPSNKSVEITLSGHFESLFCQKCSIHFENFAPSNNASHAGLSLVKKWETSTLKKYV